MLDYKYSIEAKKVNIIRIDLMVGGVAEKKSLIINLLRIKTLPIHRIPKVQFLQKYAGKRTQGIVVSFTGKIIKDIPSFKKIKRHTRGEWFLLSEIDMVSLMDTIEGNLDFEWKKEDVEYLLEDFKNELEGVTV